jgi:hypothetical protein
MESARGVSLLLVALIYVEDCTMASASEGIILEAMRKSNV